jgi:hypothetical protein
MLNSFNLPIYFIHNDLIRIKISYDYTIDTQSQTEVKLEDYVKMLNTYAIHDEFIAYITIYDTIYDLMNNNCHNTLLKEDIRRFTYFNYDGTLWNITELLKVHEITVDKIDNIIGTKSSLSWITNMLSTKTYECTIPMNKLNSDVISRIFGLMTIYV